MSNIFITGISSGLGEGLCKHYLEENKVFAISRSKPSFEHKNLFFKQCDLEQLDTINTSMKELIGDTKHIDIAILNAGSIDDIKTMSDTSMKDLNKILNINTFSNKYILDFFIKNNISINQIIGISSGASKNGHKGWGSYCLSKIALNMLLQLYSSEMTSSHILALAPGVIETKMVAKIINEADPKEFPSVDYLKDAPKFTLNQAIENITSNMDYFKRLPSGSYMDVRDILKDG